MTPNGQCTAYDPSGTVRCERQTDEGRSDHLPYLHQGDDIDGNMIKWGGHHWIDSEDAKNRLVTFIHCDQDDTIQLRAPAEECDCEIAEQRVFNWEDVVFEAMTHGNNSEFYREEWVCVSRVKVRVDRGSDLEVVEVL